jgi:hypothetical protein
MNDALDFRYCNERILPTLYVAKYLQTHEQMLESFINRVCMLSYYNEAR